MTDFNPLQMWAAKWGIPYAALADLPAAFWQPLERVQGGSEAMTQAELRVTAPKHTHALWRNNKGAMQDQTGRLVRYGLGHDSKRLDEVWKSSDLVGITRVPIMPHHIGQTFGVFTAVEVKEPGWKGPKDKHEQAQASFLATVAGMGGLAMFATSVNEYIAKVPTWGR